MLNSLSISKIIYELLKGSEYLAEAVGSRIYPVIAEEGTTAPFIVFERSSVSSNILDKDFYRQDSVEWTVTVVTKGYLEGVDIANAVRSIFDVSTIASETVGIRLEGIVLSSAEENWGDAAYEQTLKFSATSVKY